MLRWRLILGAVLIAGLAALCWLDHATGPRGAFLAPVAVLLCIAATGEAVRLLRGCGTRPAAWAVYSGALLPVLAAAAGPYTNLLAEADPAEGNVQSSAFLAEALVASALLVGVVLCGAAAVLRFDGTKQSAVDLAASVFIVIYIGGSIAMIVLLRLLGAGGTYDRGIFLLLATIAIVKAGDTGAYTVGRLIGRHKLAPRLSPGKTWEGAAGAVGFSVAAGLAALTMRPGQNETVTASVLIITAWAAFSVVLSVLGLLGDLVESLLKRSAGVKDSSAWLPGFGGILDIVDSLLLAAPAAYGLAVLGFLGP